MLLYKNAMLKNFFLNPSCIINYQIKKLIKSYNFKNLNILDFGCGEQPYKVSFCNNNYYPFDINKKKFKLNKKIKYDVIFMSFVLYQIKNPEKIMAELKKLTKPSSIFLIIEPVTWFDDLHTPQKHFLFSSVLRFSKKNRLKILDTKYFINNFSALFFLALSMMNTKINKYNRYSRIVFLPIIISVCNSLLLFNSLLRKSSPISNSFQNFSIFKSVTFKKIK